MERRPDQDKFDQFVAPLGCLDEHLEVFARKFAFNLERNQYRKPGRILRKKVRSDTALTQYFIELYLEPIWYDIDFGDDLPYTFSAGAHFEPVSEKGAYWAKFIDFVEGQTIRWIAQ